MAREQGIRLTWPSAPDLSASANLPLSALSWSRRVALIFANSDNSKWCVFLFCCSYHIVRAVKSVYTPHSKAPWLSIVRAACRFRRHPPRSKNPGTLFSLHTLQKKKLMRGACVVTHCPRLHLLQAISISEYQLVNVQVLFRELHSFLCNKLYYYMVAFNDVYNFLRRNILLPISLYFGTVNSRHKHLYF